MQYLNLRNRRNNAITRMIDNFVEKQYEPYHRIYTHSSGYHIYLGDITAATDIQFIRNMRIGVVVTASADMDHLSFDPHVRHHVYNLLDVSSENLAKHFGQFYILLENQLSKNNVLVHCFAGISRSSTLVISYLMKKNNWTFKIAIAEVRKHRPQVLPNLGFERQLKAYEKELKNSLGSNITNQSNIPSSLNRKYISKTSQSKKHHQIKNTSVGLPQIYALGRTLGRNQIPVSNPLLAHPSSQMENRKIKRMRQIPLFDQQPKLNLQGLPGINMELSSRQNHYNPTPKKPVLKAIRRRSLSNNRNSHRQEGTNILQQLDKDVKYDRPALISSKFILRDPKFTTEKAIRRIGL